MSEAPPAPRRNVGPYRVERVLGRGGMGVVLEGVAPDGTHVAIKLMRDPSDEGLLRFEREALIRIDHPHVVRLLDTGRDHDGSPYIVFELLRGESLKERIRRGAIGLEEAVEIGRKLCLGLHAAHSVGVIHRDLKPGNIHATEDGAYKILDFGLALRYGAETQLVTADRAGMGTPAYLSPEQARGDRDIDARTDLWSLGAVLYEILTGRKPFARDSPLGTMLAILLEEVDGVRSRRPDVPPPLAAIVERCLEKTRERRWSNALELERALASVPLSKHDAAQFDLLSLRLRPQADDGATQIGGLYTDLGGSSIPAGEQRVVAIVLAEGVTAPERFAQAVRSRGGLVITLVGHRTIGLFGAERWEGDEVERAALAALDARAAAEAVSIASGRAARSGQGIAGAVVRAAEGGCHARLAGVAADVESARWLGRRFLLREAHEGYVEIVTDAGEESALGRDVARTPTLGRDVELARIERTFEAVGEEQRARAALVTGPLGIGKSALLLEATARLEAVPGAVVFLTARAEPHLRERSHALVAALLAGRARVGATQLGWARLEADVALALRQNAVLELASDAIDDAGRALECAELLGELLGVPMPESGALLAARSDPRLMHDRVAVALQDYFGGLAAKGVLAVIVEDLQWADSASLDVLDELLAAQRDASVFVLGTARPELFDGRPTPFSTVEVERIELRGLGLREVAKIAAGAAGRSLPETLVRTIVERTGGNPLFVEQIALELGDGEDDSLAHELPLPLTVEAAVQSRLDHLPPAEKDLCKRASILGRAFAVEELAALGIVRGEELLAALARRDVVVSSSRARGGRAREYGFRSTLVQEVAYRMLADGVREDLHRRAAAHLATTPGASHEERASHHERGGEGSLAATCWTEAAHDAARRGDGAAVLRCVDNAFALGAPDGAAFGLRMAKADALRFLGRRSEQAVELDAAIAGAPDDASLARALAERTTWLWRTGNLPSAIDEGARAVSAARRSGDDDVTLFALGRHGAALLYAGAHDEAQAVLDEAGALASDRGPIARATVADLLAQLAAARGDPGAAEEGFREALAGFTEAGDLRRAANAEANLADAENRIGSYGLAVDALRAACAKCRRVGNRLGEGYALANLGYSLWRLGRHDEALDALTAARAIADSADDGRLRASARAYVVRAAIEQAASLRTIRDAEDAAAQSAADHPTFSVLCLAAAARGHLALRQNDAALERSARALALRDDLGSIEEDEAEVFLANADALAALGRTEQALAILARGRARLLDVAARIRDPARRARFLEDVPAHRRLARADHGPPASIERE